MVQDLNRRIEQGQLKLQVIKFLLDLLDLVNNCQSIKDFQYLQWCCHVRTRRCSVTGYRFIPMRRRMSCARRELIIRPSFTTVFLALPAILYITVSKGIVSLCPSVRVLLLFGLCTLCFHVKFRLFVCCYELINMVDQCCPSRFNSLSLLEGDPLAMVVA